MTSEMKKYGLFASDGSYWLVGARSPSSALNAMKYYAREEFKWILELTESGSISRTYKVLFNVPVIWWLTQELQKMI